MREGELTWFIEYKRKFDVKERTAKGEKLRVRLTRARGNRRGRRNWIGYLVMVASIVVEFLMMRETNKNERLRRRVNVEKLGGWMMRYL